MAELRFDGPVVLGDSEESFPNGDSFGLILLSPGPLLGPQTWSRYRFAPQNFADLRRALAAVATEHPDDYADRIALQREVRDQKEWFRLRVLPVRRRDGQETPSLPVDDFLIKLLHDTSRLR
jgi:hypothetical protein